MDVLDESQNADNPVSTTVLEDVLDEPSTATRAGKRSREDEACKDQPAPKRKDNHQTKVPNTKPKIALEKGDRLMINWEGEDITATVLGRGGKTTGKTYNYFNVEMANTLQCCMNLEEVDWRRLNHEECNMVLVPRERHKEFQVREAKRKELGKLNEWNAVEAIDDVGQFRISCTWVVWMKPQDEGDPECRARLVARGYEEEHEVPSDSPTVDKASIRLILMICASRKWIVRTSDVKSAFLQGRELDRHVVMKPPREAGIPKGKLWKLRVALYGLDDASLRFYQKVAATFKELDLQQSKLDPALFYKLDKDGVLQGIVGTHVDDFLHCGNKEFEENVTKKLAKLFQMGKTASSTFKYVGMEIEQREDFSIKMSQEEYVKEIEMIVIDPGRAKDKENDMTEEEKSTLRKTAGKIGWLGRQTRPDVLFSQVEMSTKFLRGKVLDLVNAQKAVKKVFTQKNFIVIKDLGPFEGWKIEGSTDGAHRNLQEAYSTQATVIMIRGAGDSIAPLSWMCNKIKRICGSTMEAETIALVDGMGHAVYTRALIEEICGMQEKTMQIEMLVDNEGTCEAVRGHCSVSDKRLNIEMSRAREYRLEDNIAVNWVPSREQLADPLTKKTANSMELLRTFQEGTKQRRETGLRA